MKQLLSLLGSSNYDISEQAVTVLATATEDEQVRESLNEAAITKYVPNLLSHEREAVQMAAMKVMSNLAISAKNRKIMNHTDTVRLLEKVAKNSSNETRQKARAAIHSVCFPCTLLGYVLYRSI